MEARTLRRLFEPPAWSDIEPKGVRRPELQRELTAWHPNVEQHAVAPLPNLLFIAPIVPADTGNGLAMRAGMFLRALAPLYNVFLHVVPVFSASADPSASPCVSETCTEAHVQPVWLSEDPLFQMIARIKEPRHRLAALASYPRPLLCRFATTEAAAETSSLYQRTAFDAIHVFRLYLAPFAAPFLDGSVGMRGPARRVLDLDDYESRTRSRIADLQASNGDTGGAYLERAEVAKYERLEDAHIPRFEVVYTANDADRAALAHRYRREIFVHLPNAVRVPSRAPALHLRRRADGPYTFLFVGTLDYYPNEDAARFFCREVLPLLCERAGSREVRLVIAGARPTVAVRALAEMPGVAVAAGVPDLAPLYRNADAVVVPLRAGGGTRIKILEAFSYRRPVVASTVGAEGLGACHEKHLLIADSASALAAACLHLMNQPVQAAAMADRAFGLLRSTYSLSRVSQIIEQTARGRGEEVRAT